MQAPFETAALVATLASAYLVVAAMIAVHKGQANPALRWWVGALVVEAINFGLSSVPVPMPTSVRLLIGDAGHALAALLVLAGTFDLIGRHDWRPWPLVGVGAAALATCGGLLFADAGATIAGLLGVGAAICLGATAWVFWRRYGADARISYLLVASAASAMTLYLLADTIGVLSGLAPVGLAGENAGAMTAHGVLFLLMMIGLIFVAQDGAQAPAPERQADSAEHRLRQIASVTGHWVWELGPDLRFTYFSDHFEDILGVKPEHCLGKTRQELLAGDPDSPAWRQHMAEMAARRPIRNFQYALRDPAGRVRHIRINGLPVFDDQGEFLGYRGTGIDVTAEIEAKQQAARLDECLRGALDSLPHGVALFDADDRLIYCNAKHAAIYPELSDFMVPGRTFSEIAHKAGELGLYPAEGAALQSVIDKRLALHREASDQPFLQEQSGGRWVQLRETKTKDGGTVTAWADVTSLKRRERALALLVESDLKETSFLDVAAQALSVGLATRWVGVAELRGSGRAHVLCMWDGGQRVGEFDYDLANTPCEALYRDGDYLAYPDRVAELFPEDKHLAEIGAVSYQGHLFRDSNGNPVGHVFALHDRPVPLEHWHKELTGLIGHWVGMALRQKNAEDAWRASDARLRTAQRQARIGYWSWSFSEQKLVYWSEEAAYIGGYKGVDGDVTYELMCRTVHPEDRARVLAEYEAADSECRDFEMEYRVVSPDGDVRFIYEKGQVEYDESGRPLGHVGILQDVTELKKTEEALRRSEASLANAQRIARLGNWDWNIVTNELSWSDEIYRIFGLEPQEFGATYEAFLEQVHPDDRATLQEAVDAALAGASYAIDHRIVLDDGNVRTVHEQAEVEFDASGKPIFMRGTVQDITERKRREAALRERTDFVELSKVVAAAANEATTVDQALQICVDEVCKSTGWPVGHVYLLAGDAEELMPTGIWHVADPARFRSMRRLTEITRLSRGLGTPGRVLTGGAPEWIADIGKHSADPHVRPFEDLPVKAVFAFPITIGPKVVGVLEFFADHPCEPDQLTLEVMTHVGQQLGRVIERAKAERDLKAAKEAAEDANRAKSEFLATMSHELRTPLNAIIGFSDIICGEILGPLGHPDYKEYVFDIRSGGKHLLDLINDILDVSRCDSGQLKLVEEVVDLAAMLQASLAEIEAQADEKGLVLEADLPERRVLVRCDERRIKQVLANLFTNAVKFTTKGRIEAKLSGGPEDGITFKISDTGIGISESDLERVFEPFTQVNSSLSRRHDGTGLGLPLCRSLVELHGGRLTVESTFGQGTTASVWLPPERVIDSANAA